MTITQNTRVTLRLYWFPIVASTLMLALYLLPERIRLSCYFTPEQFHEGRWWLLLSSQWVHLSLQHMLANVLGVLLLCVAIPRVSSWQLALCTLICLLVIAIYLVLFPDTYAFYAGFSGVLYGLFFFAGIQFWSYDKRSAVFVLTAIIIKWVWDTVGPNALETVDWLGARIAVEIHLAGIIGACVFSLLNGVLTHSLLIKNNKAQGKR